MAVGYRSFLDADSDGTLIDTVVQHIGSWSRSKGVDVPPGVDGRYLLGTDEAVTVLANRTSAGTLYRWRLERTGAVGPGRGTRTTVTAAEYPDRTGWIWTEIESASGHGAAAGERDVSFMSVPPFVRTLIGRVPCYDGRTPIMSVPLWIHRDVLPDLMEYLADDARRGPVYVMSQGSRTMEELDAWAQLASRELQGMGATFLLEGEAEPRFNELVGASHAIVPGTVRTYAPLVGFDDPEDARRHWTLDRDMIERHSARRIGLLLGAALREQLCPLPVPEGVQAADVALDEQVFELEERMPGRTGRRRGSSRTRFTVDPAALGVPDPDMPDMVQLGPADWTDLSMSEAELRIENARLRRENLSLKGMVDSCRRYKARIRSVLQALDRELSTLRHRLGENVDREHGRARYERPRRSAADKDRDEMASDEDRNGTVADECRNGTATDEGRNGAVPGEGRNGMVPGESRDKPTADEGRDTEDP